jgi:hypothetical protein
MATFKLASGLSAIIAKKINGFANLVDAVLQGLAGFAAKQRDQLWHACLNVVCCTQQDLRAP